MIRLIFIALFFCFALMQFCFAADGAQLRAAFDQILEPELNNTVYDIENISVTHKDFVLKLNSGNLAFAEPITLDDSNIVFAAYFIGDGNFTIAPTEVRARNQIEHTYDTTVYHETLRRALLVFSPPIFDKLQRAVQSPPSSKELEAGKHSQKEWRQLNIKENHFFKGENKRFQRDWRQFTKKENYYFVYETLRNIYEPSDEPFLFVNLQKESLGFSDYYLYNPLDAEEIKVYKNKIAGPLFRQYVKTVSSYSCLLDSTGTKCHIVSEPQVKTIDNNIIVHIADDGIMYAQTAITCEVLKPPAQMLWMTLHEDMLVDSITDDNGRQVGFVRYNDSDDKSNNLYLFLNKPSAGGDTLHLSFFYHGPIIEFSGRNIVNQSGIDWYPAYIERDSAVAKIEYTVPYYDDMRFNSTGTCTAESIDGHTEISTWTVDSPEPYIYFDYIEKD